MVTTKPKTPAPVISRFGRYLLYLSDGGQTDDGWISSGELARRLSFTACTVRQDFRYLNLEGCNWRGYRVDQLCAALGEALGVDVAKNVAIVGAGEVGASLALRQDLPLQGFRVRAIFDADPDRVGVQLGALRVRHVAEIRTLVREERIQVGVVAVPARAARAAAFELMAAGVHALLNLTTVHINAPADTVVGDVCVLQGFLELSGALHSTQKSVMSTVSVPSVFAAENG